MRFDIHYDYVIVGGGSAGCVLANRLSEDPSTTVLVLEAGRPDYRWDVFVHMPAALTFGIGNRLYDWRYESEPEPQLDGRRIYHARGKLLGGSSAINGMIFQRGNPADFERWAQAPGMGHWSYAHCLPYFKLIETCTAGADVWRGGEGPLVVERGPATSALFGAWLAAGEQAGYRLSGDVNGFRQEGFAAFDRNVHRGRRLSAARAYLHPVMSRPNLRVVTRAQVDRVLFDRSRAVGVEYRRRGVGRAGAYRTSLRGAQRGTQRVGAGEVVLCGGAFNTPQLLQLSGVGEPEHLEGLGVEVTAASPGVGENLADHLEVYVQHACAQPVSMQPYLAKRRAPWVGLQWLARRGPGATNHFEAGAFVRSRPEAPYPNVMMHFLPVAVRYDGSEPVRDHGYQVHVGPMLATSRGSVRIASTNPRAKPKLTFNYLSTQQDRDDWIEAVAVARDVLARPAFKPFDAGELSPGPDVRSAADVLAWVRREAETALHPSGTAAMGAVVDPSSFAVYGTERLRVVDASVMPSITNANIYAPVMMIAERAADAIRANTPLAPSEATVYLPQ